MKKLISLLLAWLLSFSPTFVFGNENWNPNQIEASSVKVLDDLADNLSIDEPIGQKDKVELVRVVDGDTVRLLINGKEESVRLIGIDTPESVHRNKDLNSIYGRYASRYVELLLEEHKDNLYLELDISHRDRYGRVLGYLWIDDIMVNELLLAEGYAQLATYPPNTRYVDQFILTQEEARDDDRGFWSDESEAFRDVEKRNKKAKKEAGSSRPDRKRHRRANNRSNSSSSVRDLSSSKDLTASSSSDNNNNSSGGSSNSGSSSNDTSSSYQETAQEQESVQEAAPEPEPEPEPVVEDVSSFAFIGNRNTGVVHYSWCGSVSQMNEGNKVGFYSLEDALNQGYRQCKKCGG